MLRGFKQRSQHYTLYSPLKIYRRSILTDNRFFKISPEVRDAVMGGRPVVALETTIYTHGFPYPDNIELSKHLEKTVRDYGAVPATIGVLNGVITVGMSTEESVQLLETSRQPTTIKLSRRDISYICGLGMSGRKLNGGTTIAGTMVLAHLAGIKVFATGGLGGVHRGGENSMDISADLSELGRTPVTVISGGCKSFLDIPRTLEYLETQGAGVATFSDGRGHSVNFPAFWTRDSGIKSPKTVMDEQEAAAIIYAQSKLNLNSGLLFASPIPEDASLSKATMDNIIADAIVEAERSGVGGSDNTPFILDYIHRVTKGQSIEANRKLVETNVIRGAKTAVALAKLEKGDEYDSSFISGASQATYTLAHGSNVDVVVAGSLAVDLSCDYAPLIETHATPALHTSNPASISQDIGGVGHNIATAIHYTGARVRLCTPIGDDLAGTAVLANLKSRKFDTAGVQIVPGKTTTPQYVAVNDKHKNLFVAMADMRLLEDSEQIFDDLWANDLAQLEPKWLVVDANWSPSLIRKWVAAGRAIGARIALEPVSVQKASRLFYRTWKDRIEDHVSAGSLSASQVPHHLADLVTPNQLELEAMVENVRPESAWAVLLSNIEIDILKTLEARLSADFVAVACNSVRLLSDFPCILTKLGPSGVLLTEVLLQDDPRLEDTEQQQYLIFKRDSHTTSESGQPIFQNVDPQSSIAKVAAIYVRHYLAAGELPVQNIVSVNGVGDTFLGVLIAASMKHQKHISEVVDIAQRASMLTLQSSASVSPKIRELW